MIDPAVLVCMPHLQRFSRRTFCPCRSGTRRPRSARPTSVAILVFVVEPGAFRLAKLLLDPHCSVQEVDILDSERQQLGDPQAKGRLCDHHCLTPCWHCLSQGLHRATDSWTIRSRSERAMLSRATGGWTSRADLGLPLRRWTAPEAAVFPVERILGSVADPRPTPVRCARERAAWNRSWCRQCAC